MKIKIEMSDPKSLQEFQEFVYEKEPELMVDEVYDMTPGFNREPIAVAVIIALGGPVILKTVQTLIKEYFKYKREKEKEITERAKIESQQEIREMELSISEGKSWRRIEYDNLQSLR
jgi:hypothetical protein